MLVMFSGFKMYFVEAEILKNSINEFNLTSERLLYFESAQKNIKKRNKTKNRPKKKTYKR